MPAIRPGLRLRASRKGASAFAHPAAANDRLTDLKPISANPGNLIGRLYVPPGLNGPAPLVVVLHGCTQNAALYDHGSGWSTLADRAGFILLFPEQQRPNNPMLCFNWFADGDNRRGRGEAASIHAMIEAVKEAHPVDPARIFVTGLSAGGAMTSVMLATYPETFAGGAIIAGVAFGCAEGAGQAFECMSGRGRSDAAALGGKVLQASPHKGPWPRVQVWQGSADTLVVPANADAIVRQWAQVQGLAARPDREDRVAGYPRRTWLATDGTALIEQVTITGMGHGVPLDPGTGAGQTGEAGAHMLDVGLSSTDEIAAFFGIAGAGAERMERPEASRPAPQAKAAPAPPEPANGIQATIEQALRAAGLMG
jgi:poly(hydroxyalkanoate) depolymerase family esterase